LETAPVSVKHLIHLTNKLYVPAFTSDKQLVWIYLKKEIFLLVEIELNAIQSSVAVNEKWSLGYIKVKRPVT